MPMDTESQSGAAPTPMAADDDDEDALLKQALAMSMADKGPQAMETEEDDVCRHHAP